MDSFCPWIGAVLIGGGAGGWGGAVAPGYVSFCRPKQQTSVLSREPDTPLSELPVRYPVRLSITAQALPTKDYHQRQKLSQRTYFVLFGLCCRVMLGCVVSGFVCPVCYVMLCPVGLLFSQHLPT